MTSPNEPAAPVDYWSAISAVGAGAMAERMGLQLTEASPDRVVGWIPVAGNTQPYGILHGGASVALAETLGSFGSALLAGPGRVAMGVEINASHHRAVRSGRVTGVASVVQSGRTLATWDVAITDDAGRRVCTARITCLMRDAVPGENG